MFKFDFSSDDSENTTNEIDNEDTLQWFESQEIKPEAINVENLKPNTIKCGSFIIKHVHIEQVGLKSDGDTNNSLLRAEHNHSDLITGVYEGGLKVWECTYDLLNFINESGMDLTDKKVLDLGCGAGLVGILSCLKGATTVFQDYNSEVINSVTIPNVATNNISFAKCSFYCGDWTHFLHLNKQTNHKFDYIFTSETIYNTGNYRKLLDIFKELLETTGTIYLAAKYHYFGVGGGIGQFEDMLKGEDFNYSTCWICTEGVKRAIIKITLN